MTAGQFSKLRLLKIPFPISGALSFAFVLSFPLIPGAVKKKKADQWVTGGTEGGFLAVLESHNNILTFQFQLRCGNRARDFTFILRATATDM